MSCEFTCDYCGNKATSQHGGVRGQMMPTRRWFRVRVEEGPWVHTYFDFCGNCCWEAWRKREAVRCSLVHGDSNYAKV